MKGSNPAIRKNDIDISFGQRRSPEGISYLTELQIQFFWFCLKEVARRDLIFWIWLKEVARRDLIFQIWLKGIARWDSSLTELHIVFWFWLKGGRQKGSHISDLVKGGRQKGSHISALVKGGRQKGSHILALVKGNRQMGFQVHRATSSYFSFGKRESPDGIPG